VLALKLCVLRTTVCICVIGCCGLQVVELVASDEGEVVQSLAEVNRCARVLQVPPDA
jgi:hypothetical protein